MQNEGQPLSSEELYGTAKKWTRELEQLPLHSHGAVIQALNIAFEHRNLSMKREEALRVQRLQEQRLRYSGSSSRRSQRSKPYRGK